MEREITAPIGLSAVDLLIYLIPGALTLTVFYLSGCFKFFFQEILKQDVIIIVIVMLGASYVIGHIMHLPATWVGAIINKILGDPIIYLITPEKGAISETNSQKCIQAKLKARIRHDFSYTYKLRLREILAKYWKLHDDLNDLLDIPQHFALTEVLVEERHPRAWEVHERFYLRSCLLRGMILPLCLLGIISIFNSMIMAGIFAFLGCVICTIRYHSLLTASIMQIYNQFYDFYLSNYK